MKKFLIIFLSAMMIFALVGCENSADTNGSKPVSSEQKSESSTSSKESPTVVPDNSVSENSLSETPPEAQTSRILVAYFSRADENYNVGYIEKGNTEIIAEMIAGETGADLFHIERDPPYSAVYDECLEDAKKEKSDNARPALKADCDISGYDVIFLGYPIWCSDMPMPVYTFLESKDWNGKTVIPFSTHEGSGLSTTEKSIVKTCSGANVLKGLATAGTTAQNERGEAKNAVLDRLNGLEY